MVKENTFGMWKARFGVIQGVLWHDPSTCAKIITATACLHNFAVSDGDIWVDCGYVRGMDEHNPLDNYHNWSQQDRD